jgi:hypothetical protein
MTPIGLPLQINMPSLTYHVSGEVFTSTHPVRSLPLNKSTHWGIPVPKSTKLGIVIKKNRKILLSKKNKVLSMGNYLI